MSCRPVVRSSGSGQSPQHPALLAPHSGTSLLPPAIAGTLDLSVFDHRISPLSKVNEVLAGMDDRDGGFTNFVIDPSHI